MQPTYLSLLGQIQGVFQEKSLKILYICWSYLDQVEKRYSISSQRSIYCITHLEYLQSILLELDANKTPKEGQLGRTFYNSFRDLIKLLMINTWQQLWDKLIITANKTEVEIMIFENIYLDQWYLKGKFHLNMSINFCNQPRKAQNSGMVLVSQDKVYQAKHKTKAKKAKDKKARKKKREEDTKDNKIDKKGERVALLQLK